MPRTNELVPIPLDILRRVYTNYNKIMIAKDYHDFGLDSTYVLDSLLSDSQQGIFIYRLRDPEKQKNLGIIKSRNFDEDVVTRGIQYFMRDEEIHVPLHVKELEKIYNMGVLNLTNYHYCDPSWLKGKCWKSDNSSSRMRFNIYYYKGFLVNHEKAIIHFRYATMEEANRIIKEFNEGYFSREKYVVSRTKKDN